MISDEIGSIRVELAIFKDDNRAALADLASRVLHVREQVELQGKALAALEQTINRLEGVCHAYPLNP